MDNAQSTHESASRSQGSQEKSNLKRLFVVTFAIVTGLVFATSVVIGIVIWYTSRPETPKPWDTSAIVATYDDISTEGDKHTFVFSYVLENTTAADDYLRIDLPLFIPTGRRRQVEIHFAYPFPEPYPTKGSDEDREAYRTKLQNYLNEELGKLNGFSLFDQMNRYEIRFPKGW